MLYSRSERQTRFGVAQIARRSMRHPDECRQTICRGMYESLEIGRSGGDGAMCADGREKESDAERALEHAHAIYGGSGNENEERERCAGTAWRHESHDESIKAGYGMYGVSIVCIQLKASGVCAIQISSIRAYSSVAQIFTPAHHTSAN
jgi:hypothetical protein